MRNVEQVLQELHLSGNIFGRPDENRLVRARLADRRNGARLGGLAVVAHAAAAPAIRPEELPELVMTGGRLMIMTSHLLPTDAWATVTTEAAAVVGTPTCRLEVGNRADLVAVRAATLREAIAFSPQNRIVWRHGVRLTP